MKFRTPLALVIVLTRLQGAEVFCVCRAVKKYLAAEGRERIEKCLPRRRSFRVYLAASVMAAFIDRPGMVTAAVLLFPAILVMWSVKLLRWV